MSATIPQDIPTPAMVIDEVAVDRNIKRLADYAKKMKVGIRPHTKTHKSVLMAKKQTAAGATGLTVAKVGEAEVMADAGDDLLLAYPALDRFRTARIAEIAKRKTLRMSIDSKVAADAIAEAARSAGSTVGILVDLDAGMHRTGLQTPELALELAQHVSRTKGLRLDGLFFYPGHIWGTPDAMAKRLDGVSTLIQQTLELWKKNGLEAKIVSGGSTPTAYESHHVKGTTEIRPGTYIYYDRNCLAGNWCTVEDCAARVIVTVVSDGVPGKVVVDAGNKTLTMDSLSIDPATGGHGLVVDFPLAKVVRLSEEHGEIDFSMYGTRPKLGTRLQIVPNHICPCVNLQESVYLRHADGSLERLEVQAKGKLF